MAELTIWIRIKFCKLGKLKTVNTGWTENLTAILGTPFIEAVSRGV